MDLGRLRAGEWILGLGSLLMLVALLTPWYEAKNVVALGSEPLAGEDFKFTGFEAFTAVDLILAAGALLGLGFVVLCALQRVAAVSIAGASLVTIVFALLVPVVVFRVLKIPDLSIAVEGRRGTVFESTRSAGVWLAMAANLVMLGGALASMRDERITGDTRSVDPATIETLPAPKPSP